MDAHGSLEVRWVQGFTSKNVQFVDKKTICYACGIYICFLNLETKIQSLLPSPGRGLGAFTANGNSGIIAFSEQKLHPSIFVYVFPELKLKNELKGTAQLDYTSLALSDGGPYLACCSALPDHTVTLWNWESGEILCSQPQAGKDAISLVFNPMNGLQMCAVGTATLTVWNIEKSASFHVMKPSVVQLPAADGSRVEEEEHRSDRLTCLGPRKPSTAISGLKGAEAESVMRRHCTKSRLTPAAICWTATSKLYVGCEEGFLLLLDPESLSVSVVFNPKDSSSIPELKQDIFLGLAFNGNHLVAAGKERTQCLQIKGTKIEVTETWEFKGPASVTYSPDYETLILSSDLGQIYTINSSQSEKMVKVLDVHSGSFVAGALLHPDENICVSVRDSGVLQLWSSDGLCLGFLSLHVEVTTLACCPVAQCAAVGTKSGHVLFIDLNKETQPRLVHQVHLYRRPVDHLVFDQEGHYLLTGASDLRVYVLDAKPSNTFSVIGHTVVPGPILSLSTQCIRDDEQVKVLALCTEQMDQKCEGSLLTLLTLPTKGLTGPECVDRHGCLSHQVLKESRYKVPHPLTSCVLGVGEFFAYCHRRKTLQRFLLPQDTGHLSSQQVVQLKPDQEVKGHPLGPASLALSPHRSWLASGGRDGLLCIWPTASMELYKETQCHSWRLGGVGGVSFSADSQKLVTAGLSDGSLLCTKLRLNDLGAGDMNKATHYSRALADFLENTFKTENSFLSHLAELCPGSSAAAETAKETEVSILAEMVDGTEQEQRSTLSDLTWLESKQEAVVKEDNQHYYETKNQLRKTIRELRDAVQEMMQENETLPDMERLEQREFNLDVEEQKRLEAMVEQEVTKLRNEIELENLAKCYTCDVLKREFWYSMKVKGRAIKAFQSEHEVKNYAMKERTEKELEDLRRVQNMRKIENAACVNETLKKRSKTSSAGEEEGGEEGQESAALTGSLSAHLGVSDPYMCDQFELQTTEQKINQITLLQDAIHQIKTAFNAEFEVVHRQKLQELSRVKDRNGRIREITEELNVSETLWEPSLTDSECPERALTVDDSKIKVEKYLTPEQREEEERKLLEEQRRMAAMGEDTRGKALGVMMEGVLQVKKEDILKMEIPAPEFVLTKPDSQWSEEEKKAFKEFENKATELSVEQKKYRKVLESEMKKLQESNKEAAERFDKGLTKLSERKMKSEMAIHQEELKITSLVYSVHTEEEIRRRELAVRLQLEEKLAYKDETREELKKYKDEEAVCHETYDSVVAEDKILDKDFRKEFFDVPNPVVDLLYKLYKRRPRVQKMRTQTDNNLNPFKEQRLCGSMAPDGFSKMLKAMEELDAVENMPEGLNQTAWEKFCLIRRTKVESEQQVKLKALALAEMQAFLQKRLDEDEALQQEVRNLTEELESLHKEKSRFLSDVMVQVLIKQGQVEVAPTGLAADYSGSILHHRSVVEDLNTTIRMHAEQKLATMVECKDFRKGIIQQEWENKRLRMLIEDLQTKARDLQMLRLNEEQREYLKETNRGSHTSRHISNLEKSMALKEKMHLKRLQQHQNKISQLNRQAALKAEKNAVLEQQLADMEVTVAERRHVYEAIAVEDNQAAQTHERYQEIVQRKKLQDLARAQAQELALLHTEAERLRMKNFPALDQLKHS
ncbi:cilia- and flagella-associated protein 43 [Genypterus blacodes]|uniref:cilia- and flagella-associated protein 43 n=1 Tax=Genypterus blacodes TaxID=154954 RepID=UPI003F777660